MEEKFCGEYLSNKIPFQNAAKVRHVYDEKTWSMISKAHGMYTKESLSNFKELISIYNDIDPSLVKIDEKYHELLIELCRRFVNVNNLSLLKYLHIMCENLDAEYIICTMYKGILSYQHIGFIFRQDKICGKWKRISNYSEQFDRHLGDSIIHFIKHTGFYVGSNSHYGHIALKHNGMWISR